MNKIIPSYIAIALAFRDIIGRITIWKLDIDNIDMSRGRALDTLDKIITGNLDVDSSWFELGKIFMLCRANGIDRERLDKTLTKYRGGRFKA